MKVLFVSLLRLGDVILQRELAQTMKRSHPHCEIHFLIHSEFQSVESLLPEVDVFHLLPRKEIQQILVERSQSSLVAFQHIQAIVGQLNQESFDIIFNATHNHLSVRLIDLLQAKEKRGVTLAMGRKVSDANAWQTYLNENFSQIQSSRFHYLEVLSKSLGLPTHQAPGALSVDKKKILFQVLTSDSKKNWGLSRFQSLMKQMKIQFPGFQFQALCSPQEKKQVSEFFSESDLLTPSLDQLVPLLQETHLLVTGDTSIQHLAAQNGCQVVSLFLGSADPIKTAPWQTGAWILQGQAPCAPCSHQSNCFQLSHLCAESITVQTVQKLVSGILTREEIPLTTLGLWKNFESDRSLRTWPVANQNFHQIEHFVWTTYLDGSEAAMDEFSGTASDLQQISEAHLQFRAELRDLKRHPDQLENIEEKFPQWKDSLVRLKRDFSDPQGWSEAHKLCEIRQAVLDFNLKIKAVDDVRENRKPTEARAPEA